MDGIEYIRQLRGRGDHSWVDNALCAGDQPDMLFVQGAAQREVRRRCLSCTVRVQCLLDALENRVNFGVWGGLTERERRALLKRNTGTTDWCDWLESSADDIAAELRTVLASESSSTVNR